MFSAAVELLLNVAWREATARRHTHLTIEHLLYVLAHDAEAEKILTACGADLPRLRALLDKYLQDHVEQFRRGDQKDPEQTLGFRRLLQTAVLHVQSSGKDEVDAGDLLAAMLQQPKSYAIEVPAGAGHHAARHPQLRLARHREAGRASRRPSGRRRPASSRAWRHGRGGREHGARSAGRLRGEPHGQGEEQPARSADRPRGRTPAHARDPLPAAEEQPGVRRGSRRGQDGDGRGHRDAPAAGRRAGAAEGCGGVFARHDGAAGGHALPRRLRGALQGRDQCPGEAAEADSLHRRDPLDRRRGRHDRWHARPGDADQAGAVCRRAPRGRARRRSRSTSTSRKTARWRDACRRS